MKKDQKCGVAIKDAQSRSGWSICHKPAVRDLGFTAQMKMDDGSEQMGRFFCADHKGCTQVETKQKKEKVK